jgi:uncharacterized membrane protein
MPTKASRGTAGTKSRGKTAATKRAGPEPQAKRSAHRAIKRYGAVYAAVIAGVAVGGLAAWLARALALELGTIAFCATYLGAMVARLPHLTQEHLRAHADESNIPGYLILVLAVVLLIAVSVSLFGLLNSGGAPELGKVALGSLSLLLGWLTLNAMLAFHYAYEYYSTDEASPMGADGRKDHVGGLDFPGPEAPDGLSFLYFSFVVAMTAQVSDVQVTSNGMRRLVLLHGIFAFLFNTVIIAVAVNIVVSLGK